MSCSLCKRSVTCKNCGSVFCGLCARNELPLLGCAYCDKEICKSCTERWGNKLSCKGCRHMRYLTAVDILANEEKWSIGRDIARKVCKKCSDCEKWNRKNVQKCKCFGTKELRRLLDINKHYNCENDRKEGDTST